jgi:hypothetical protein
LRASGQPLWQAVYPLIHELFHDPQRFVNRSEHATWREWLFVICLAFSGFSLFGMSTLGGSASLGMLGMLRLPLLFMGGLVVSLPALYIFQSYLGSQLTPRQVAATGVVALAVPAIMMAGLAPINWFFGISTNHEPTLWMLQRGSLFLAAYLGYLEVRKTLPSLEQAQQNPKKAVPKQQLLKQKTLRQRQITLLRIWLFLYLGVLFKLMQQAAPIVTQ